MNNNHLQTILNVRYQTELLEALSWDEEKLSQLLSYLETEFNNFGEPVALIIKKIFAEQFNLIVDNSRGEGNEY